MSISIKEALALISDKIRTQLPNGDADIIHIMEHVAEMNESGILQSLEKKLSDKQEHVLHGVIDRIDNGEPLAYVLGNCEFHGRRLYVDERTLIPRIETETLVDLTLGHIHEKLYAADRNKGDTLSVADIGTGSGCIIIATALMVREPVTYFATDESAEALNVARKNAKAYELDKKITFLLGDLLGPVPAGTMFDIIVANLPYVKTDEIADLDESVRKYEPLSALDGGKKGTTKIDLLLSQSPQFLKENGVLLVEIQPSIAEPVQKKAKRVFPSARIDTVTDTFGRTRFVTVKR